MSLLLGILFARRAARPVRDLSAAAQVVAAGHRPAPLDADRGDEFAHISQALGAIAGAAEGEEQLRQGFAAVTANEMAAFGRRPPGAAVSSARARWRTG